MSSCQGSSQAKPTGPERPSTLPETHRASKVGRDQSVGHPNRGMAGCSRVTPGPSVCAVLACTVDWQLLHVLEEGAPRVRGHG